MHRAARTTRGLAAAALGVLALATGVSALAAAPPLRFVSGPARAPQGGHVDIQVAVRPGNALCTLKVNYANGAAQAGLNATRAVGGRAAWSWDVPLGAAVGRASLLARCTGAGTKKRSLLVVGASAPVRIDVVDKGYTVRNRTQGGADVSYGITLQNRSTTEDALYVTVLTNFVLADGKLIGSATETIASIPAGASYALGSGLRFPGDAPIDRLEVVVQAQKRQPHKLRTPPIENIHLEPSVYDEGFLGGVVGELVNDDPSLILQRATLSAVVLDAAGHIVGGGKGYAFAALPPSTRELFKITSGVTAIPMTQAVSAVVSTVPTWALPNSS